MIQFKSLCNLVILVILLGKRVISTKKLRTTVSRLSKGDHHHFVWIRAEDLIEVYIPLAFHIEQGFVDVTLDLSTQILQKRQELTIEILPEGSIVHKHTSVLLDLKNRANVLQFMNIIVDETPLIPYEVFR